MLKLISASIILGLMACNGLHGSDANDLGKQTYTTYCEACHGKDGKLKLNDAPDLTVSKMTLEERIKNISEGSGMMPAFLEVIGQEEIEAVAAYLDELKKIE